MASRFNHSHSHPRSLDRSLSRDPNPNSNPRSTLFDSYNQKNTRARRETPVGLNIGGGGGGYGYSGREQEEDRNLSRGMGGYGGGGGGYEGGGEGERERGGFRPATPNRRGQYSDAVLSELEGQNENEEVEGMSARVKALKELTLAIGTEIRTSSALAEQMNDSFEKTRTRLGGTMRRMLRMADRTGVGWRVWVGFFCVVGGLFWWVWVF